MPAFRNKKQQIIDVMKYVPTNPIAEMYVGGMASVHVYGLLGAQSGYGKKRIEDVVDGASREQVDRAHEYLKPYIEEHKKKRFCKCCGQAITR